MQAAQNSTDRRKVQKALEERARAKQSLHTGLADGVYASHFQKLRLQAREGERRDAVARNERIDAAVLSHKINARFALWKDQFDTEMKASIDVVFAMGWNCGSQLGLNATDVTPEPNEGDSSSSDDEGGSSGSHRADENDAEEIADVHGPGEHAVSDDVDDAAVADAALPPAPERALFVPRAMSRFRRRYVRLVACGARHTLLYCCATQGRSGVYSWGRNTSGQLGLGSSDTEGQGRQSRFDARVGGGSRRPPKLQRQATQRQRRTSASVLGSAAEHATTTRFGGQGELPAWVVDMAEAAESATTVPHPTALPRLYGATVTHLACGDEHSLVATELWNRVTGHTEHTLHVCGENATGQLGLGDSFRGHAHAWCKANHATPMPAMLLHRPFLHVAAGGDFSVVATAQSLNEPARVLACGDNRFGQLGQGVGNRQGLEAFKSVPALFARHVTALACGTAHAIAATRATAKEGAAVWAWGCNTHGQLGLGHCSCEETGMPVRVPFGPKAVSASEELLRAAGNTATACGAAFHAGGTSSAAMTAALGEMARRRKAMDACARKIQAIFRGRRARKRRRGNRRMNRAHLKDEKIMRASDSAERAEDAHNKKVMEERRKNEHAGLYAPDPGFPGSLRALSEEELLLGSDLGGGCCVSIGAGANHSVCVVAPPVWELGHEDKVRGWSEKTDGVKKGAHRLFGFGDHTYGQLGVGSDAAHTAMTAMKRATEQETRAAHAANARGGAASHRPTMRPLECMDETLAAAGGARQVACGRNFTLILARHDHDHLERVRQKRDEETNQAASHAHTDRHEAGTLFGCGDNQFGQLGLGPPRGPRDTHTSQHQQSHSQKETTSAASQSHLRHNARARKRRVRPVHEPVVHAPRPLGFPPPMGSRQEIVGVPAPCGAHLRLPSLGPGACHAVVFKEIDPSIMDGDEIAEEVEGNMAAKDPALVFAHLAAKEASDTMKARRLKLEMAAIRAGASRAEAAAAAVGGGAALRNKQVQRVSHVAEHPMMSIVRELGASVPGAKPADSYLGVRRPTGEAPDDRVSLAPCYRDRSGRLEHRLKKLGSREHFVENARRDIAAAKRAKLKEAEAEAEHERRKQEAFEELKEMERARAAKRDEIRRQGTSRSLLAL